MRANSCPWGGGGDRGGSGTVDYMDPACYELAESFSNPDYQNNGSHLYKGKEISARKHYAK